MRFPQTAGMTGKQRIMWHLEHIGPLNPLNAWTDLGIYRLAARISELKKAGAKIDDTEMVDVANQYGETCRVGQYKLLDAGGQKTLSL